MIAEFKGTSQKKDYQAALKRTCLRMLPIILVLAAAMIAFGILGLVLKQDSSDNFSGIFLICIGAALPFIYILLVFILSKKQESTNITYFGGSFYYRFDDDGFVQEITNDFGTSTSETKYIALHKVFDYKDIYIFYLSNSSIMPVAKQNLVSGSAEALSARLAAYLPGRYKRKFK